jgi:hypothetical protein
MKFVIFQTVMRMNDNAACHDCGVLLALADNAACKDFGVLKKNTPQ